MQLTNKATYDIMNFVENVGRFILFTYNSSPERPTFSTNRWTNWWAVLFGGA